MALSLNGWPVLPPSSPLLVTKKVPQNKRSLTGRKDILPLFLALAYDYDDWVRSIDKGATIDEGLFVYRKSRLNDRWSNHASATAVDLNWSQEGAVNSAWGRLFFANPDNQKAIQNILSVYPVIGWGGAWNTVKDYMHWEIRPGVQHAEVMALIKHLGIRPNGVRYNDKRGRALRYPRGL